MSQQPASPTASQIGTREWSYAGVCRDDGLSYLAYVEQLTFLLFLKMADELTKPPYGQPNRIPKGKDDDGKSFDCNWPSLLKLDGAELCVHYRRALRALGGAPGLLGTIFKEGECKIKDPAKLRRLIVDLIDRENWLSLDLDVKGVIYEELLSRSAAESTGGAGQYFTPRPIIQACVDVMRPTPEDSIMDPAAGTAGFLTVAYQSVIDKHGKSMDKHQKRRAREELVTAQELVPDTARLCAMNLFLHGIGGGGIGDASPVISGKSSLDTPPKHLYSMVPSLDLFWIKDDSLEDSDSLPDPDVLAAEIVEDLQDALEQFTAIAKAL